jgi:hypothetical protein
MIKAEPKKNELCRINSTLSQQFLQRNDRRTSFDPDNVSGIQSIRVIHDA